MAVNTVVLKSVCVWAMAGVHFLSQEEGGRLQLSECIIATCIFTQCSLRSRYHPPTWPLSIASSSQLVRDGLHTCF